MSSPIHPQRIHILKEMPHQEGTVVYWMNRDMRVDDNWALLFAQSLALKYKMPLAVVFVLLPKFLEATERSYGFLLKGLHEVELNLKKKNIPFYILSGFPEKVIPQFVKNHRVSKLVKDFFPLNIVDQWIESVAERINASFYEVDAHNVVPARVASDKQEFGAYTIRPKIHRRLSEFLEEFPSVRKHSIPWTSEVPDIHWNDVEKSLRIDRSVKEVHWIVPGELAAKKSLQQFLTHRLKDYAAARNNPVMHGQSNLSPYLHFGHLSPQRISLEVIKHSGLTIQELLHKKENTASSKSGSAAAFLEELIIRRELSDNYTLYNKMYDRFEGFPAWAQMSHHQHRKDKREFIYTLNQFEDAGTGDRLWNAAQQQMRVTGKMHGYMRMYWAKKILEWTPSVEEAMMIAVFLNDKYSLDGRDPNGYAGIAWSIGGVHDRAWFDRPVYGKIRYMNDQGCKRKFNVEEYIRQADQLVNEEHLKQ